jgi:ATP-binding cassette subfamily B protein
MTTNKDFASATLKLYWRHARKYPWLLGGLLVSSPVTILVKQYLPPLILANVLARLAAGNFQPHHLWASFGGSLIAYAALEYGGSMVLWRVVDVLQWTLEGKVRTDMARRVFGHLLSQSAKFHANHFSGSLVTQTNKLIGGYIRFADTTTFSVLPLLAGLVITAIILAPRAPWFVVVLIAFAVFYMGTAFWATRDVRARSGETAAAESAQTGYLADNMTNVMAVKSFAGETYENRAFARATDHTRGRILAMMRGHQKQQLYFGGLSSLLSALSLLFAVLSVMLFDANIATVFLIFNYTASIANQLFAFSNNALRNYNRALGDSRNMMEILQIEPEVQNPSKPQKPQISAGKIDFSDVTFAHDGADDAIFQNFNITIKPGEKIGLVGHSGSGKTTFTRLLLRFSDLDSGAITIDGQNIASISQDDLRENIAYVPQEPMLFHRSLRDNIAYGKPGASQKAIEQAATYASAHDFIRTLPAGYDTLVGERGVKLSGGQRQRIAIARALLKDAPILVLDEATASLDSESERLIQKSLWKLMEGRTAIVVAHRLSTIQHLDRIVVLSDGHIAEQGSHSELLKQKGTYAKLWQHQSGGFLEE